MANISAIKLPNGDAYNLIDKTSGWTKNTGTVTSVAASGSGGISISGSPITTSGTIAIGLNLSTAINGLGEGTSPAQRADYIVAQYAGGGTTTTTYHRRSLANIFAALNASDITTALGYTPYNSTNPNGYTTNTGTVTKVTAGTGLSIGSTAGGNFTTTGTINHTNSVTAQTTQAVYPIKIDAQGHISAYGTAVTSMPASDVYSWAKASTKPTYNASEVGAIATSAKGAASGVAELDSSGKVPSSQLPSFVDDVLEYDDFSSFPSSGETGKIYIAKDTNKTYRWGGSTYVEISPSLALGETSSTAYRGDRGKTAYNHSQSAHARTDATAVTASSTNGNIQINGTETTVYTHPSGTNPHGTTKSDVGLGNVGNFKAVSTVASQGLTDTEKSNARANIGAGTSSLTLGTTSSTAAAGNHSHTFSAITSKPTTLSGYGITDAASSSHTHTTSLATDTGTSSITLASAGKYKLTAGDTSVIFTMPTSNNYVHPAYDAASAAAIKVGRDATGHVVLGNALTASDVGAATSGHTHAISLATDSGTSSITLASATKYKLTAGGNSVIFTMPTIPNVSYPVTSVNNKTGAVSLTYSDVGAAASSHTHNYAASSTAGGAATSLANFKVTTTSNIGVDAPGTNAVGYISGLTKAAWNYQQTDGALYTQWYNASWIHEIFGDYRTGQISVRGRNNGSWQNWRRILDESNWSTFITIPTVPTTAASHVTNITIADHGTTSVGSASGWNAGSASTWAFEDVSCDDITAWSAGSYTRGTFSGGSGTFTATVSNNVLSFSHTHNAATHAADSFTAPSLSYTGKTASHVKSGGNGTAPSLTITSTNVVNGKGHSVTDNGHTHTLS